MKTRIPFIPNALLEDSPVSLNKSTDYLLNENAKQKIISDRYYASKNNIPLEEIDSPVNKIKLNAYRKLDYPDNYLNFEEINNDLRSQHNEEDDEFYMLKNMMFNIPSSQQELVDQNAQNKLDLIKFEYTQSDEYKRNKRKKAEAIVGQLREEKRIYTSLEMLSKNAEITTRNALEKKGMNTITLDNGETVPMPMFNDFFGNENYNQIFRVFNTNDWYEVDNYGDIIKGSGKNNFQHGSTQQDFLRAINAATNDPKKLENILKVYRAYIEKTNKAYDTSTASFFDKGITGALQNVPMLRDMITISVPTVYVTKSSGLAQAAVINYSKNLGAGEVIFEYLSDKPEGFYSSLSEQEVTRLNQVSQMVGWIYGSIEQFGGMGLSGLGKQGLFKGLGAGNPLKNNLQRALVNKLVKLDSKKFNQLTKQLSSGGFTALQSIITEIIEEGAQKISTDIGADILKTSDPNRPLAEDIKEGLPKTQEDFNKLLISGLEEMKNALPAVTFLAGAPGGVIETISSRKTFKDADTYTETRKESIKYLIDKGLTEEEANNSFDEIMDAETENEVSEALNFINNKIIENNEFLFNENKIKIFTNNDFNNLKKNLSKEELEATAKTFGDIAEDFILAVTGDARKKDTKDARKRYNLWAKNNQDMQYFDFIRNNKQKLSIRQRTKFLTDQTKEEILNTDKHDAIISKIKKEGETLEDAKKRYIEEYDARGDAFVRQRISFVRKALSRIIPNLQILIAETDEEFAEIANIDIEKVKQNNTSAVYSTKNKNIILNNKRLNSTTITHEAFHALLDHFIDQKWMKDTIKNIFNAVYPNLDSTRKNQVNRFMKRYDVLFTGDVTKLDASVKEEGLSELAALMSDFYKNQFEKIKIKGFKNRILILAGIKGKAQTDKQVIDMFNSIAKGFGEGKVIEDKAFETLKTIEKESTESTEQDTETKEQRQLELNLFTIDDLKSYLSEEEIAVSNSKMIEQIFEYWQKLPSVKEMAAVAEAGIAKKGWYKQSAKALFSIFGNDAPRFAALLAATSPKVSVEVNLLNTLTIWKNWIKAGRPTDKKSILNILGESVQGKRGIDSVLDAWINNSVRALSHDFTKGKIRISGAKVNSFMKNLIGEVDAITLDTWMAKIASVKQTSLGKSVLTKFKDTVGGVDIGGKGYKAYSARIRQVTEFLNNNSDQNWTNSEVQETIWSWAKILQEKAMLEGERRTEKQILKEGDLTDAEILDTVDFGTLLAEDTVLSNILKEAGYNEQLNAIKETVSKRAGTGTSKAKKDKQAAIGETGSIIESDRRRLLYQAADRLTESRTANTETKEQRSIDDSTLDEIIDEINNQKLNNKFDITTTIPEFNALLNQLDLDELDSQDKQGFQDQIKQALIEYGITLDDNGNEIFNEEKFFQRLDEILQTQIMRKGGSALNAQEQAGFAFAVSLLFNAIAEQESNIQQKVSENKVGDIFVYQNQINMLKNKAQSYITLVISSRSETGRVLGTFRYKLKNEYSIENIEIRLQNLLIQLTEDDYKFFEPKSRLILDYEDDIEQQQENELILDEQWYDDLADDAIAHGESLLDNPKLNVLEKAKAFIKETSTKAAKFFNKFGNKEQRLPYEAYNKAGILDTDKFKGSPEKLIKELFLLTIHNTREEGKPLVWGKILKEIQDILEEDGLKHDIKFIKKSIVENILPFNDLKNQHVAFLNLIKSTFAIELGLSQAIEETFKANKQLTEDDVSVQEISEKIGELLDNLTALSNTVNTIYSKKLTEELTKKVENIREQLSQIINPDFNKETKNEAITEAKNTLKDLKKQLNLKKQIAELEKQIKDGKYDIELKKRTRTSFLPSKETLKLMTEKQILVNQVNRRIAILERQKESLVSRSVRELAVLNRMLNAMLDASALLIQGVMFLSMPLIKIKDAGDLGKNYYSGFFIEAFQSLKAFKFFGENKGNYHSAQMQSRLKYIANYFNLFDYGLEFSEAEGGMNNKEELFQSSFFELINKIPKLGKILSAPKEASEAQYTNFLNAVRIMMSISYIQRHKEATPDQVKRWVNFVNFSTGRGNFAANETLYFRSSVGKSIDNSFDALSYVFFAPRLTVSTFTQPLLLIPELIKSTADAFIDVEEIGGKKRKQLNKKPLKEIINQYSVLGEMALQFVALAGTFMLGYFLMNLGKGDDEEKWELNLDSTSSEFLKVRKGNQVRAIHNRYTQNTRLMFLFLQEFFGITLKGKEFSKNEKNKKNADTIKRLQNMVWYKTNPIISNFYETLGKKHVITKKELMSVLDSSKPATRFEIFITNFHPIVIQSFIENFGLLPTEEVTENTIISLFGLDTAIYKDRSKPKRKKVKFKF